MNTVAFFSHSLLPSSPYRNVILFSNLRSAWWYNKKEGRLINGDFKVVMRSTDTNNTGETENCAALHMHACTHTRLRTRLSVLSEIYTHMWAHVHIDMLKNHISAVAMHMLVCTHEHERVHFPHHSPQSKSHVQFKGLWHWFITHDWKIMKLHIFLIIQTLMKAFRAA